VSPAAKVAAAKAAKAAPAPAPAPKAVVAKPAAKPVVAKAEVAAKPAAPAAPAKKEVKKAAKKVEEVSMPQKEIDGTNYWHDPESNGLWEVTGETVADGTGAWIGYFQPGNDEEPIKFTAAFGEDA
jgi:hypothetical protein